MAYSRQSLRYVFHHGTHKYPNLHRRLNLTNHESLRVYSDDGERTEPAPKLRARTRSMRIERLADRSQKNIDHILDTGRMNGEPMVLDASAWTIDELPGPNVVDKESVVSIARMAANAYVLDDQETEWLPVCS
jgi:lipase ATG15